MLICILGQSHSTVDPLINSCDGTKHTSKCWRLVFWPMERMQRWWTRCWWCNSSPRWPTSRTWTTRARWRGRGVRAVIINRISGPVLLRRRLGRPRTGTVTAQQFTSTRRIRKTLADASWEFSRLVWSNYGVAN